MDKKAFKKKREKTVILLLKTTEGTQGYSILREGVEEIEKSTDGFSMPQFEKKQEILL